MTRATKVAVSSSLQLEPASIPWLWMAALATLLPHFLHLPTWLSLLSACALGWRALLWKYHRPLPARGWLGLLALVGVMGIGWEFHTFFGRDAGVALIVFAMALKPLEMRTQRDAMVLILLGFFLLLTHYFYSQSIPTGLWLLTATLLLYATLIRIYGGAQPVRAILRYAALLLVQSLPFMLLAFLLFPRIQGPLWGLPQDAYSGMTGLSEEMSPGSLNELIQSGALAFRVEFIGQPPEKALRYWRGPVLDEYDGTTWRAHKAPNLGRRAAQIEPRGASYQYVITLEAHNKNWLLALDLPTAWPEGSALAPTLQVLNKDPVRSRARFSFTSAPYYTANREEDRALLQHALLLPRGINSRAQKMAQEWRNTLSSPQAISDAALQHFRQEAFYYTLRPPRLGANAVDDFLFNTRRGFCEHYASAYVFLMRAAGVPARVIAGYQGGEINPVDGFLSVRQSDAHAWAEIWLENAGWVRIDPTAAVAPSRIEQGIAAALPAGDPLPALMRLDNEWLRGLRNRWDATNNAWNQWVLGYNPARQRELLEQWGLAEPNWQRMTAVLTALGAVFLALIAAWTLYQRRTLSPAQRAWQQFCRRLKRLGLPRADWEGPLDFSARVARQYPEIGNLAQEAARLFARLNYGVGRANDLPRLKHCIKRLPLFRRK